MEAAVTPEGIQKQQEWLDFLSSRKMTAGAFDKLPASRRQKILKDFQMGQRAPAPPEAAAPMFGIEGEAEKAARLKAEAEAAQAKMFEDRPPEAPAQDEPVELIGNDLRPGDSFTLEGKEHTVSKGKAGKLRVENDIRMDVGPDDRLIADAGSFKSGEGEKIDPSVPRAAQEEFSQDVAAHAERVHAAVESDYIAPEGLKAGLTAGQQAALKRLLRGPNAEASRIARSVASYFEPAYVMRDAKGKIKAIRGLEDYMESVPHFMRGPGMPIDSVARNLHRSDLTYAEDIEQMADVLRTIKKENWPKEKRVPPARKLTPEEAVAPPRRAPEEAPAPEARPPVEPETPTPAEPPAAQPGFTMPRGTEKSKPRYGYRDANYNVEFESDLDRALHIVRNPAKKSRADAQIMDALRRHFPGETDTAIRNRGKAVQERIKARAKEMYGADEKEGILRLPSGEAPAGRVPLEELHKYCAIDEDTHDLRQDAQTRVHRRKTVGRGNTFDKECFSRRRSNRHPNPVKNICCPH